MPATADRLQAERARQEEERRRACMRCGDTDYLPRVRVTQVGCRRPRKAEERRRVPRRRDEGGVRCLDARTAAPPTHRTGVVADGRAACRDASRLRGMFPVDE